MIDNSQVEAMVQTPTVEQERHWWAQGELRLAGVDEVGLGCLAGPIVAAAVIIPVNCVPIVGVRDSKQLSDRQRQRLFPCVHQQAMAIGVGMATPREIEQINVLQASYLAMARALGRIGPYDRALIDGRAIKNPPFGPITTIIHGDATCYAIACASIIAKVRRDRLMQRLARRYPGYGWERNAGYGTRQHLEGLTQLGITPWHRRSYAPVQQAIQLSLLSTGSPDVGESAVCC
jgi:ribonuclease HII